MQKLSPGAAPAYAAVVSLLLFSLLWCDVAAGQERHVSLDLVAERELQPDVVCVLSKPKDPVHSCILPRPSTKRPAEGEEARCLTTVEIAWESNGCKIGPPGQLSSCKAGKKIGEGGTKAVCALNSQTTSVPRSPRLLLLRLLQGPVEKVEPALKGITLNGNKVILRVAHVGSPGDEAAANLEVYGGSYRSGNAAVSLHDQERFAFDLVPHVLRRPVVLPPFKRDRHQQKILGLTVTLHGGRKLDPAPIPWTDPLWVDLPAEAGGITLEAREFTVEESWLGDLPPDVLRPRLKRAKFKWGLHCLYDPDLMKQSSEEDPVCPVVSLPEAMAECDDPRPENGACEYECAVKDQGDFMLPTRAEFSVQREASDRLPAVGDAWSDDLRYAGQTLRGYVRPEDRHLLVDLSSWPALSPQIGERVSHVLIRGRGTEALRVNPSSMKVQRVRVPQLSCADTVEYEVIGDLKYKNRSVAVGGRTRSGAQRPGAIRLPPPSRDLDDLFTMGIVASGGGHYPFDADADTLWKWYAMPELVARYNARALGVGEHGLAMVDVRVSGVFSFLWTRGLDGVDDDVSIDKNFAFARVLLTGHAGWLFGENWSVAVGGGLGYGIPLLNSNRPFAPAQLVFAPASAIVGYRVNRKFALEVRLMSIYERGRVSSIAHYGLRPEVRDDRFLSLFSGGGLRFDL